MTNIDFANILRERRAQLKITQEQAANLCGIKRPTYATYEEGRAMPRLPDLVNMSKSLGYDSLDDFLGIKNTAAKNIFKEKYLGLPIYKKAIVDFIMGLNNN